MTSGTLIIPQITEAAPPPPPSMHRRMPPPPSRPPVHRPPKPHNRYDFHRPPRPFPPTPPKPHHHKRDKIAGVLGGILAGIAIASSANTNSSN